jgi:S-adenosylmethionine hydrolase
MARSNNAFIKKQKADKKAKLRREKLQRKLDKKANASSTDLESMIAYVDKFGNITSEPPVEVDNANDTEQDKEKEQE